jgi:N-acetylmuramoyl-L-alanine amidase
MKNYPLLVSTLPGVFIAIILAACSKSPPISDGSGSSTGGPVSRSELYREVNVKKMYIRRGTHGRKVHRSMRPKYITVHSTQNYTGDAYAHAKALRNGKLRAYKRKGGNRIGYLTWHFTIQEDVAIQHIPTNEQGEHADFDGPGNNYSIGIEMAEHRGNSRAQTTDRTARLCASLMKEYNIPLSKVVPHYHWPRKGASPENKNCPHFLMDNGRPGKKWDGFLDQVNRHYKRLKN